MFVGFYKANVIGEGDVEVVCVLGRSALTVANKAVSIIKQPLVHVDGVFTAEGARVLAMCQAQNLFTIPTAIDPDISFMVQTQLQQLRDYKIANPSKAATMKVSIKRYFADQVVYLDWEDRYVKIKDVSPEIIGQTYISYFVNNGGTKIDTRGSFETVV